MYIPRESKDKSSYSKPQKGDRAFKSGATGRWNPIRQQRKEKIKFPKSHQVWLSVKTQSRSQLINPLKEKCSLSKWQCRLSCERFLHLPKMNIIPKAVCRYSQVLVGRSYKRLRVLKHMLWLVYTLKKDKTQDLARWVTYDQLMFLTFNKWNARSCTRFTSLVVSWLISIRVLSEDDLAAEYYIFNLIDPW